MSHRFALFGSGKGREGPASVGELLARLLDGRGAAEPRRARRPRRGESGPSLAQAGQEAWFEAAQAASGELVALSRSSLAPDLVMIGARDEAGDRAELGAIARTLASLDAREGPADGLVLAQRASEPALRLLRHRAGGGRKFMARGGALLIHLAEPLAQAVEAGLDAGGPIDAAREDDASLDPPLSLALDGGQEFALSRFLVPPFFPIGPAPEPGAAPPEAAVFWDELSCPAADPLSALWFAAQLGEARLGFSFLVECPADRPDREEFGRRVLPVLRAAWSAASTSLAELAPAGSIPRFGQLASPPPSLLEGAVRVSGEMRLGAGGFPFALRLPPRLVAALSSALGVAIEPVEGRGGLADLVALNEALLHRWVASYRDVFLKPRQGGGGAAPALAALLASLGSRDAGIVLQNCIVPRYGLGELPYLFYCQDPASREGQRVPRPMPYSPFRDEDILRLLPATAREEWERERSLGLGRRAPSRAACALRNDEAAAAIWAAARAGKLELSPGSYELVERLVGAKLEAASRARLESLAREDVPFGILATLDRRDVIQIVGRLSNRALAQAAIGEERRLDLLRKAMSQGRRRDFDEELQLARDKLKRGEFEAEAAARAKLELQATLRELAEGLAAAWNSGEPPRR